MYITHIFVTVIFGLLLFFENSISYENSITIMENKMNLKNKMKKEKTNEQSEKKNI